MTSAAALGGGPGTCRACGASIAPGATRCDRCGAAQVDVTCPHCRATAGASPDRELRYVCDVCGGPRIPLVSASARRSGKENAALKRAEEARRGRGRWRGGAIGAGVLLAANVLLFLIVPLFPFFTYSVAWFITLLLTSAPLAALVAWASSRAKAHGREIQPSLDAAWLAAAGDVAAQSPGPLTARELGAALGLDEAKAEELLAMIDVNRAVGQAPRTDAMAAFDAKLRIATDAAAGAPGATGATAAELEAAAEEEAAGAAKARDRQQNR